MQPVNFPEANRTFTKPEGWTDEDCQPLPIQDTGESLVSCWQPDEAERARLAAGAPVQLTVVGRGHPPVMLGVRGEPVEAPPPPEVSLTITGIDGSSLATFLAKHPGAVAEAVRRLVMRGDGTERVVTDAPPAAADETTDLRAKVHALEEALASRVRRLRLRSGDVIVLECARALPRAAAQTLGAAWRERFPDTRAVVFDGGVTLAAVLAPKDVARLPGGEQERDPVSGR